jgi:hypothetical protein
MRSPCKARVFNRLNNYVHVFRCAAFNALLLLLLLLVAWSGIVGILRYGLEVCIAEPHLANAASPRPVQQDTEASEDHERAANSTA